MTTPEDARESARRAAADAGAARPPGEEATALERAIAPGSPSYDVLQEWARIGADPTLLYSTRRFGGPITFLKRGLVRFLRQYTREVESQQTRFNLAVLARLRDLEDRSGRADRSRSE